MFKFNTLVTKAWCSVVSFFYSTKGASGIEYAIIATIAAIAIALFTTEGSIGERITGILETVRDALPEISS